MKLLREFFRLRGTGVFAVLGRGSVAPRDSRVTVPAPLPFAADDRAMVDLPQATAARAAEPRREPASFLKTSRHRRRGSGR